MKKPGGLNRAFQERKVKNGYNTQCSTPVLICQAPGPALCLYGSQDGFLVANTEAKHSSKSRQERDLSMWQWKEV